MICNHCNKCEKCGKPYSSNSTYAEICKDFEKKKMTNYEKIKQMSVEEMARSAIPFFQCPYDTPYVGCEMGKKFDDDCIKCTKHWLESEAVE